MSVLNLKGVKSKDYKKVLEEIQGRLENYDDAEGIHRLLNFQRNFRSYSFQNTLLIYFQKPTATKVAGLRTWNKLGRKVTKGETGIRILAPCLRRFNIKTKVKDEKTGEEEIKQEKVSQISGFRFVSVFDISQTEGKEINGPSIQTPYSNHEELYYKIIDSSPIPILIGQTESVNREIKGYFAPASNHIKLSENLKGDNRLLVLIHELAHYYSHKKIDTKYKELSESKRNPIHEIVAEGSSAIFFCEYDLDLRPSYQYLYSWTRCGKDNILEYGELIRKTANHLIALAEEQGEYGKR